MGNKLSIDVSNVPLPQLLATAANATQAPTSSGAASTASRLANSNLKIWRVAPTPAADVVGVGRVNDGFLPGGVQTDNLQAAAEVGFSSSACYIALHTYVRPPPVAATPPTHPSLSGGLSSGNLGEYSRGGLAKHHLVPSLKLGALGASRGGDSAGAPSNVSPAHASFSGPSSAGLPHLVAVPTRGSGVILVPRGCPAVRFVDTTKVLTPRGLRQPFGFAEMDETGLANTASFVSSAAGSKFGFVLYIWNGTDASKATQAAAVLRGLEIERALRREAALGTAYASGSNVPVQDWRLMDDLSVADMDVDNASPTHPHHVDVLQRLPHDMRREWHLLNHLNLLEARARLWESVEAARRGQGGAVVGFENHVLSRVPWTPPSATACVPFAALLNLPPQSPRTTTSSALQVTVSGRAVLHVSSSSISAKLASKGLHLPRPLMLPAGKRSSSPSSPGKERDQKFQKLQGVASEVEKHLWVGSTIPAGDKEMLKRHGITYIINLAAMVCECKFRDDFIYEALNLMDSADEDISSIFPIVLHSVELERQRGGQVYVHCHQGVSRSCTVVIAYFMWRDRLTYDAGYNKVRAARAICSPNPGFIHSLLKWQHQIAANRVVQLFRLTPFSNKYYIPIVLRSEGSRLLSPGQSSPSPTPSTTHSLSDSTSGPPATPSTPMVELRLDPRTGYFLVSPDHAFAWRGNQCPDFLWAEMERLIPKVQSYCFGDRIGGAAAGGYSAAHAPEVVRQGKEPREFWETLQFLHPEPSVGEQYIYEELIGAGVVGRVKEAVRKYRTEESPQRQIERHQRMLMGALQPPQQQQPPPRHEQQEALPTPRREAISNANWQEHARKANNDDPVDTTKTSGRRDEDREEIIEVFDWPQFQKLEKNFEFDMLDDELFVILTSLKLAPKPICHIYVWINLKNYISHEDDWPESVAQEARAEAMRIGQLAVSKFVQQRPVPQSVQVHVHDELMGEESDEFMEAFDRYEEQA